jgi:hypothetical protein
MTSPWTRVTKEHPCPICGKPDWCCVGAQYVNCMRQTNDHPAKNGGFLFPLGDTTKLRPLPAKPERPVVIDAGRIMDSLAGGTWPEMVEQFAASLGVTVRSLDLLGVAWSPGHRAWAVPMRDWRGNTIGIRLRLMDGTKRAVKGSHNGLFYAEGEARTIYFSEGESDTAAGLSIGLCCVGRPGCLGYEPECDRLLRRKGAQRAVILADNDDPGQRGAEKLQAALSVPSVVIFPPAKDLRASIQAGLTADVIESMISSMVWTQPQSK